MKTFPGTIRGPPRHRHADHGGGREPAVPAATDGWLDQSVPRPRRDFAAVGPGRAPLETRAAASGSSRDGRTLYRRDSEPVQDLSLAGRYLRFQRISHSRSTSIMIAQAALMAAHIARNMASSFLGSRHRGGLRCRLAGGARTNETQTTHTHWGGATSWLAWTALRKNNEPGTLR